MAARRRVDEAIDRLLRDASQRIDFNSVTAAVGVITAYLYKEPTGCDHLGRMRQEQADRGGE